MRRIKQWGKGNKKIFIKHFNNSIGGKEEKLIGQFKVYTFRPGHHLRGWFLVM
jgi:hypothetical protein